MQHDATFRRDFSASKLKMRKKVRSVPFRKLCNGAASHCGSIPQEIETVSIFATITVTVTNHSKAIAT